MWPILVLITALLIQQAASDTVCLCLPRIWHSLFLDSKVSLRIHTAVREDAILLYGF